MWKHLLIFKQQFENLNIAELAYPMATYRLAQLFVKTDNGSHWKWLYFRHRGNDT